MSKEKPIQEKNQKPAPPASRAPAPPSKGKPPVPSPASLPPLFRRVDWLTMATTSLFIFIGYLLTLSPDLSLQDSGELATGSFYAGVPHPPGYPVWTLYSHFFTVLLPFSNIAWRVSVSSAVAASLGCGLLALLVSRGSSMMMESIVSLRQIERRTENAICMVSGFVAGVIMGFNGLMWSQAVIVEVYPFSVLSLMGVLCFLLRWIYAPNERRWLYFAMFLFGICITNHMSLLLAAVGIEIGIAAAQPKLGRDLFAGNVVVYVVILFLRLSTFDGNAPLFMFFNFVGIGSIVACLILTLKTGQLFTEWRPVLLMGLMWVLGAAFYFYMPVASMTNPPMNWGYARTSEGFVHALKRGQYESVHPTTSLFRFVEQLVDLYGGGVLEQFNLLCVLFAIVPFFFYRQMQKREKAWITGVTGIFLCLSVLLLILLNPGLDRQSKQLHKVFFEASHVMIAMFVGYGLTLIAAFLATQYLNIRKWTLYGAAVAVAVGLYNLASVIHEIFADRTTSSGLGLFFFGLGRVFSEGQNKLQIYPALFLLLLAVAFLVLVVINRVRLRIFAVLGIFILMPVWSMIGHWYENEQRGHLFGYWFGHDMFTPPFKIYPEMTRDAILFGGTDPGRFCPTYMIFCESFIPPRCKPRDPQFDRRDVYIITQNALADNTYLNYIRAHYNRSTQKDPPFFHDFFGLRNTLDWLDDLFTSVGERIEKNRRARGVYPKEEIHTPSPEESQKAFNEYLMDADKRARAGQLRPGEDFRNDNGRIQVSGQIAVMAINGLLTKVIFETNPNSEFFVEESFPLDWMFPYLSPFGIIMKINHQAQAELTQEMVEKDHAFWSQYSGRLVGNWVTYDTPVSNVCAFAERLYLHRDFRNFQGDPKFIRDDDAQKAFSKLRSSIGGMYAWRLNALAGIECPPEFRVKTPQERERMIKEADFALKQSFAFCPYSPEAVYRYMHLLLSVGRIDDALMVVGTCHKLDPANASIKGLYEQLVDMRKGGRAANPESQNLLRQASALMEQNKTNEAMQLLDSALADPKSDATVMLNLAQAYARLNQIGRLEQALARVVQLVPDNPEAWYDLGVLQLNMGKSQAGFQALTRAMQLNAQRMKADPKTKNLYDVALKDQRLQPFVNSPEFKKLPRPQ